MLAITFINNWTKGVSIGMLRGANLRYAYLRDADLEGADLEGADLEGADLRYAKLRDANLRDANLRGANLRGANLGGANLGGADLAGANLEKCRGNDIEIQHSTKYYWHIVWTKDILQIGCQNHTHDEWNSFTDEQISVMAQGALKFWRDHKASLMEMVK